MIRQFVKERVLKAVQSQDLQTLQSLLTTQSQSLHVESSDLDEPLFHSIKQGDTNITHCLLSCGKANIKSTDTTKGLTPLHYACQLGDLDMVKLLLASGASYAFLDNLQNTGLHYAAEHGHCHIVCHLLKNGAKNDYSKNKYLETPLHVACKLGKAEVVQCLLAAGGSVNILTSRKETPLHLAAQSGNTSLVKLLLECGALPNKLNSKGKSALSIAVEFQLVETVQVLLQNGADPAISDKSALHVAATLNGIDQPELISKITSLLLDYGADPNQRLAGTGFSPLHGAAQSGNVGIVRVLLDRVDNIDCRGYSSKSTPLALAVSNNHPQVALLLLKRGANPHYKDPSQRGLLYYIDCIRKYNCFHK
jgi:ankyrin